MTVAVIVHVEADRPYVDSLQDRLDGVRLIACVAAAKTPVMAFDPRLPLVLVWSPSTIEMGAGAAFVALASAHSGEVIMCVVDRAPRPRAFERLRGAVVEGSPNSSLFPGGLIAALSEAHRRRLFAEAAGARGLAARSEAAQRALATGIARGLAGSVAVFGVGGAAAMAVDHIPEGLLTPESSAAPIDVAYLDTSIEASMSDELDHSNWARSEVIVVDAELADVPLANPAPARVAAMRAAAFVTDVPLEIWSPDESLDAPMAELTELAPFELPATNAAQAGPAYDGATLIGDAALAQSAEALPAI